MKTIEVRVSTGSYNIVIGKNILDHLSQYLSNFSNINSVSIISEDRVGKYHLAHVINVLKQENIVPNTLIVKAGERSKNWSNIKKVTEWLISKKVERSDFVIGLGGGVIGDLVGFAASIVRRGVNIIHIPTSLLAQVDSAIGGKTSINSKYGKNLIGTFYQPALVLSDISVLGTMKNRDFKSGYGEVIKYALIQDKKFFSWLEYQDFLSLKNDPAKLLHMVTTSSSIKSKIVEKDEKEQGLRALLNFGHTFGHALEAATGYSSKLLHGEGVVMGSCLALSLSKKLGIISEHEVLRIKRHFTSFGFKTKIVQIPGDPINVELLMDLMYQDKKVKSNQLNFVLLRKIGQGILVNNISPVTVKDVLLESLN